VKNRRSLLLVIVAVTSLVLLCVDSAEAVEYVEESDRDPQLPQQYDDPPGESYSYVYLYALYNPQTQQYFGIHRDHDYSWKGETGEYRPYVNGQNNPYHPWGETKVSYKYQGDWQADTHAYIMF
jgi:hypothetical protein